MTDKVQKILEEVVRMHNLLPVMDGDNISINYADRICTTLEMYIDSLQKEPVSVDLEKEIKEVQRNYKTIEEYAGYPCTMYADGIEWIARHFFELGLRHNPSYVSTPSIDDTLKEMGVDPNSKDVKIFKESFYKALEKFEAQKRE